MADASYAGKHSHVPPPDQTLPSNSTRQTIARQWRLLKLLPSQHPGTTSTHLHRALAEAGHSTSKRTIERDLNELAALFPLRCNDKGTPFGWYLRPDPTLHGHVPITLNDCAPRSREIELCLWVDVALAERLLDAPLADDMQLRRDSQGGAHVAATVSDEPQLMAWLLAHAGSLRIKRPHALRTAMRERLQYALTLNDA